MLIEHVLECVDGIYEDMMSEHSMELEATIHKLEKVAHNDTEDFIKKRYYVIINNVFESGRFS